MLTMNNASKFNLPPSRYNTTPSNSLRSHNSVAQSETNHQLATYGLGESGSRNCNESTENYSRLAKKTNRVYQPSERQTNSNAEERLSRQAQDTLSAACNSKPDDCSIVSRTDTPGEGYNLNPRASLVFNNAVGLLNPVGQNNCFLNSAIQVLWHLDVFRRNFRLLSGHGCLQNSCIFCAVKVLFTQFQFGEHEALPPDALRQALAESFADQQRFQLGQMDDATECFETILQRIHFHLAWYEAEDCCQIPYCLTHQKFAMCIIEQVVCECGATSEPSIFNQTVYYIPTSALMSRLRPSHGDTKSLQNSTFGQALYLAKNSGGNLPCPSGCGQTGEMRQVLSNTPEVVSIGLVWNSDHPSRSRVQRVFDSIATRLHPSDLVYSVTDESWAKSTEMRLVGLVCYQGRHYLTFVFHSKMKTWILFDDANVREVGPSWKAVQDLCVLGHYQPLLLFYADPNGCPIDVSSAPLNNILLSQEVLEFQHRSRAGTDLNVDQDMMINTTSSSQNSVLQSLSADANARPHDCLSASADGKKERLPSRLVPDRPLSDQDSDIECITVRWNKCGFGENAIRKKNAVPRSSNFENDESSAQNLCRSRPDENSGTYLRAADEKSMIRDFITRRASRNVPSFRRAATAASLSEENGSLPRVRTAAKTAPESHNTLEKFKEEPIRGDDERRRYEARNKQQTFTENQLLGNSYREKSSVAPVDFGAAQFDASAKQSRNICASGSSLAYPSVCSSSSEEEQSMRFGCKSRNDLPKTDVGVDRPRQDTSVRQSSSLTVEPSSTLSDLVLNSEQIQKHSSRGLRLQQSNEDCDETVSLLLQSLELLKLSQTEFETEDTIAASNYCQSANELLVRAFKSCDIHDVHLNLFQCVQNELLTQQTKLNRRLAERLCDERVTDINPIRYGSQIETLDENSDYVTLDKNMNRQICNSLSVGSGLEPKTFMEPVFYVSAKNRGQTDAFRHSQADCRVRGSGLLYNDNIDSEYEPTVNMTRDSDLAKKITYAACDQPHSISSISVRHRELADDYEGNEYLPLSSSRSRNHTLSPPTFLTETATGSRTLTSRNDAVLFQRREESHDWSLDRRLQNLAEQQRVNYEKAKNNSGWGTHYGT